MQRVHADCTAAVAGGSFGGGGFGGFGSGCLAAHPHGAPTRDDRIDPGTGVFGRSYGRALCRDAVCRRRPAGAGRQPAKAAARAPGFSAARRVLQHRLAEIIGAGPVQRVANSLPPDCWSANGSSPTTYSATDPDAGRLLRQILSRSRRRRLTLAAMRAARREAGVPRRVVDRLVAQRPRVVGFTTTFHQTCACLAVARRLKALTNPPSIVFGGANCEGEMGLQMIRSFPWIDYVCRGEGDLVFPQLLQRLLARRRDRADARRACRGERRRRPVRRWSRTWTRCRSRTSTTTSRGLGASPIARRGRGPPAARDLARLLVGRQAPLHVLRAQRRHDGVPQQDARSVLRRDRRSSSRRLRHPAPRLRRQHPRHALHRRRCSPSWPTAASTSSCSTR